MRTKPAKHSARNLRVVTREWDPFTESMVRWERRGMLRAVAVRVVARARDAAAWWALALWRRWTCDLGKHPKQKVQLANDGSECWQCHLCGHWEDEQ